MTHLIHIAHALDSLASAFVLGATSWFFFIQSPVLLKHLGREKFVPIQMRLTVVLFRALVAATVVLLLAALVHAPLVSASSVTALVALAGAAVNQFFIVPRALRAGGQTRPEIKGRDVEGTAAEFAIDGAGKRTRMMHQLVVLFVVVMLGGVFAHGVTVFGGAHA